MSLSGTSDDSTARLGQHAFALCADGHGTFALHSMSSALSSACSSCIVQGHNCFGAVLHPITMADFLVAGTFMFAVSCLSLHLCLACVVLSSQI